MEECKISIIVPVYNVEQELSRCVDSLIKQTYSNIEIILVDDGSPDQCPQICDVYSSQDNRIRVIHKENGGLSSARNAGLREAHGKYIMYVDSDDYIELDACEKLIAGFTDDRVDFVAGAYREINRDRIRKNGHRNLDNNAVYSSKDFIIKSILKNEWYAPAWLNLYKREYLFDNALYYKEGIYYEDMEMLPRMCLKAQRIGYINYAFYNYIIRDNSIMTSRISAKKEIDALENYSAWKKSFDHVIDLKLRRYLYGILVRYYLKTCRVFRIRGWKINGVDFAFSLKYALGLKERLKVCCFEFLPTLYLKMHGI